jgi:serine protease Do
MSRRRVFKASRTFAPLIFAAPLIFTAALFLPLKNARAASSDALSEQTRAVFERCKNAVVKIEAMDDHGSLSGSGFFVDPNGTLYTCYSVGGESRDIVITAGDMKYPAKRLAADPRSGIAILKVETEKAPFLTLGKSKDLRVASMVITIGYPLDLPLTPNVGCVGGFDMRNGQRYFVTAHIRANVPAQRGEGGAPLLDMNGEAVGILVSSFDNGSGCFALPIEAAEKVRKDVMRFGEPRPGWLGIKFGAAPNEADGSDVQIEDFVDGAPAMKSGLEKGDVLLQIGSASVKRPGDVLDAAFYLTAGDDIPVTISRAGQKLTFKIQPGDHPSLPRHTAAAALSSPPPGMPLKMER